MLLIFAYNSGGVLTLVGSPAAVVAVTPKPRGMLAARHVRRRMRQRGRGR